MSNIDKCAKPQTGQEVNILKRDDGSVYSFQCCECKQYWRVYQNQYHAKNCSYKKQS